MSRLSDIYKSEKAKGGGIFSAIGKRAIEKIDPRQFFDQSGLLAAMAPSLFKKYSATASKTSKSSPLSPIPQPSMSDAKMDVLITQNSIIATNTQINAKNSLVLPVMARDMNVMRQNIVKLVKLQGGTAATKADMFFKTAKEREAEYETQFARSTSPTPVVKADDNKSGGILGFLAKLLAPLLALGTTIVKTLSILLAPLLILGSTIINALSPLLAPLAGLGKIIIDGIISALSGLGIIKSLPRSPGAPGKTAPRPGSSKSSAIRNAGRVAGPVAAIATVAAVVEGRKDANEMQRIREKENKSRSDPTAPKLTAEEQILANEDRKKTIELDKQNQELIEPYDGKPSAAALAIKKVLRLGVGKGDEQLQNKQTSPSRSSSGAVRDERGVTPVQSTSPTQTSGIDILNRAMDREGITDPATRERIVKVAMVESSLNAGAKGPVIPSGMHKGDQAHGLLQIMPKTAEGIGFTREQIMDPETAALAGVKYFKMNLKRFDNNLDAATVAHHAGPGGAKKWLSSGSAGTVDVATGLSTDNYLRKITGLNVPTMAASTPAMPGTSAALASTPSRPSSLISDSTVAVADIKSSQRTQPVIVNAPTTNNMQQGSQAVTQYTAPSIVDSEFMRMLVSRAV
jgi:hypothetical protein